MKDQSRRRTGTWQQSTDAQCDPPSNVRLCDGRDGNDLQTHLLLRPGTREQADGMQGTIWATDLCIRDLRAAKYLRLSSSRTRRLPNAIAAIRFDMPCMIGSHNHARLVDAESSTPQPARLRKQSSTHSGVSTWGTSAECHLGRSGLRPTRDRRRRINQTDVTSPSSRSRGNLQSISIDSTDATIFPYEDGNFSASPRRLLRPLWVRVGLRRYRGRDTTNEARIEVERCGVHSHAVGKSLATRCAEAGVGPLWGLYPGPSGSIFSWSLLSYVNNLQSTSSRSNDVEIGDGSSALKRGGGI